MRIIYKEFATILVVDSWGFPSRVLSGNQHWLGAYEQCLRINGARYCNIGMIVRGAKVCKSIIVFIYSSKTEPVFSFIPF